MKTEIELSLARVFAGFFSTGFTQKIPVDFLGMCVW